MKVIFVTPICHLIKTTKSVSFVIRHIFSFGKPAYYVFYLTVLMFFISACDPNLCLNGAGCNLVNDTFTCTCASGCSGTLCESEFG